VTTVILLLFLPKVYPFQRGTLIFFSSSISIYYALVLNHPAINYKKKLSTKC